MAYTSADVIAEHLRPPFFGKKSMAGLVMVGHLRMSGHFQILFRYISAFSKNVAGFLFV